jgi:DNA-binding NtrC family response regulator
MTKPKIMVVDDEPAIAELLTRFLTKKNYGVTSFTSGKKALEHLKTNEVNLMVTDIDMPEMNGIELIKATKELKPALPILVITGTANLEARNEIVTLLGIGTNYIEKPFQLDRLEKIVESKLFNCLYPD